MPFFSFQLTCEPIFTCKSPLVLTFAKCVCRKLFHRLKTIYKLSCLVGHPAKPFSYCFFFKGTVSEITSYPPGKDDNAQCTKVPLKALSDQV